MPGTHYPVRAQIRISINSRKLLSPILPGRAPVHSRGLLSRSPSPCSWCPGVGFAPSPARGSRSRPNHLPKGKLHTNMGLYGYHAYLTVLLNKHDFLYEKLPNVIWRNRQMSCFSSRLVYISMTFLISNG